MTLRSWNVDAEIKLFSLICDYKPAGSCKEQNLSLILQNINQDFDVPFTQEQIEAKLGTLYNIGNVENIETGDVQGSADDTDTEKDTTERKKPQDVEEVDSETTSRTRNRTSALDKRPRRQGRFTATKGLPSKTTKDTTSALSGTPELSDDYSSELSDVEGEETVIARLKNKELPREDMPTSKKQNSKRKDTKDSDDKPNKKLKDTKEPVPAKEVKKAKSADNADDIKLNTAEIELPKETEIELQEPAKVSELKPRLEVPEPALPRKRTRANAKLDNVDELPAKKSSRGVPKRASKKELIPGEVESVTAESPEVEDEPKKRRSLRQTARRGQKK